MSCLSRGYSRPLPGIVKKYFADNRDTVEDWSVEKIANYHRDALSNVVKHAWENNRFYRSKFSDSGIRPYSLVLSKDFCSVPLTTKEELCGKPWILLSVPLHELSQIHVSTGTTGGEEIYIPHTWEDLHVRNVAPRLRKLVSSGAMDVIIIALPYEMSSSGLAFHRTFQKGCGSLIMPAGKGGFYSSPDFTITAAIELGATIMITTPSNAIRMAEWADEKNFSLATIPLRFIWLTGEGCSPALRDRIEGLWGCPAYFYYGSLEAGPIGIECTVKSGYHIASGHVYVEIIDPETCETLETGEIGEIVVTELTRTASPLIRYRTGDIGYIEDAPCVCGIALQKLHLRGREGDQIKIGNINLSPFYIEEYLMQAEQVGNWYQLIPKPDYLLVRAEPAKGYGLDDLVPAVVESQLEYAIGVSVKVEFVESIERTNGKTVRVIRER